MDNKRWLSLGIMQPYLFPYIGYWQLLNSVDAFILLDDVNYIKKGWINRNRILINGKMHLFTLPIVKSSQNTRICDISIFSNSYWLDNFYKTLKYAYSKSPFYEQVISEVINPVMSFNESNLSKFISHSIKITMNYLGVTCKVFHANEIPNSCNFKGEERIIELCKITGATNYLNLPGGAFLYSQKLFSDNNIFLKILQPKLEPYRQIKTPVEKFVPSLSILDAMFNCGKDEIQVLLQNDFNI